LADTGRPREPAGEGEGESARATGASNGPGPGRLALGEHSRTDPEADCPGDAGLLLWAGESSPGSVPGLEKSAEKSPSPEFSPDDYKNDSVRE
jgi:hypothetical protein